MSAPENRARAAKNGKTPRSAGKKIVAPAEVNSNSII